MKRFRISMLSLFALIIGIGVIFAIKTVIAQTRPEVEKKDGHIMPLGVTVTYPNGKKLSGLFCAFCGEVGINAELHHKGRFYTPEGGEVTFYNDTLSIIKDTNEKDALFIFKDGTERRLIFGFPILAIANAQGGVEGVPISKVKKVEFTMAPRKDSEGHAMFDDWRFSPYTGQKLGKDE